MKTYKLLLPAANRSAITAALASQMEDGKAGDLLIKEGFSQANFVLFLARLAEKATQAGYNADQIAQVFNQVAAGNSSQARQACKDIQITGDDFPALTNSSGTKYNQTLEKVWGGSEAKVLPNLSLLGKL
jgi:hypothetical protein